MDSWVRQLSWRSDWLPTPVFLGFPVGSAGKESACNAGDLGSVTELGNPLLRLEEGMAVLPIYHPCWLRW